MQVTCPVCRLQSAYDAEPSAAESRVVCARCSSEYEIAPAENLCVTATAEAHVDAPAAKPFLRPRAAEVTVDEAVLDDVFTVLDDDAELFSVEPQAILEDVFTQTRTAPAPEVNAVAEGDPVSETDDPAQAFEPVAVETAFAPKNRGAAPYDGYAAGARVMQASPLWLLVCGLAFISCIVIFNRITTQAGEEVEVASARPAVRNDATNQSAPAFMPDVVMKSEAADAPAPAREEAARAAADAEEEKPAAVETKSAPAAERAPEVAPAVASEASSGGKFTVQVGAHNASEKAEAQAAQVKWAGFEARVVAAEVPRRGTWYRVQAGRFETREEAVRHGAQMRAKGAAQTAVVAEIQ